MKVRVCPNCGKHNEENAFSCTDCGTTLSMKTIMETDSGQLVNVKPIAGYTELANISPYFEQDVIDILKGIKVSYEDIIWGCNVTQVTIGAPFVFGYLIITSNHLIGVQYESETERKISSAGIFLWNPLLFLIGEMFGTNVRPKRSHLVLADGRWYYPSTLLIDYPRYPLTEGERSSRKEAIYDLKNIASIDLVRQWYGEFLILRLIVKFDGITETTIAFRLPTEAEKVYNLLKSK